MKRIYLIDCPGVVPPSNGDTEQDILLRGVVRVENVENPAQYIDAVLRKTQTKHIERTYEMKHSEYNDDPIEFLSILARKGGRLLKGGEPDVDGVAKMVLNDFLRGKIPWFTAPPKKTGTTAEPEKADAEKSKEAVVEGRKGQLGEMPGSGKRKLEVTNDDDEEVDEEDSSNDDDQTQEIDDFGGFEEQSGEEDSDSESEGGGAEATQSFHDATI